jgi:CspA family cold shock protein
MDTGTVKWFSRSKGIGLITPDSGGKDLLAHFSTFEGEGRVILRKNQKVSFDTTIGPERSQVSNIKALE